MANPSFDFEQPILDLQRQVEELNAIDPPQADHESKLAALEERLNQVQREIYGTLNAWQRVQLARHPRRPHTLDYIRSLCTDWTELHGDRAYGDDHACVSGFAMFRERPVCIVGQQKGSDVRENSFRNYGSMHPEGYRKAMRVMRLAEKFGRPVISFIDTAGAFPGVGAEERGQAEAIARNIMEMSMLRVPIICIVIGEGGSGGALGIGLGDRILIQENAYYSVISPEGCASILWRDGKFAPEAAAALKFTSSDLLELGIADEVIGEPLGGAHKEPATAIQSVGESILRNLVELADLPPADLLERRLQKYRRMGVWEEELMSTTETDDAISSDESPAKA